LPRLLPLCSVKPEFTEEEAGSSANQTEVLCGSLSGGDLTDRVVDVNYKANLSRQLKLVDIRIEGADDIPIEGGYQFTTENVQRVLKSKEANALGFIPFFRLRARLHEQRNSGRRPANASISAARTRLSPERCNNPAGRIPQRRGFDYYFCRR
jgi:hypothetical protein